MFRAYLQVESAEHLSGSLRRGGVTDIYGFFPPHKRERADLEAHFKVEKLDAIIAFAQKQKSGQIRDETLAHLKEMVASEEPRHDVRSPLCSFDQPKSLSRLYQLVSRFALLDYRVFTRTSAKWSRPGRRLHCLSLGWTDAQS